MSVTILVGDVRERLRGMASDSVDCVVTSPPYWGLRDYGVAGQIGMEPTLAEHLALMVEIFDDIRRVLKPTGTVWLNYGDCYATAPNGRSAADTKAECGDDRTFRDKPFSTVGPIERAPSNVIDTCGTRDGSGRRGGGNNPAAGFLKPKDLCMLPNRLAIALQDAGWWVRSEIIWGKPNAMPDSSGKFRPSTAHEKIFLLTKSGDADVWVARDSGEISFSPDLAEQCPLVTKPDVMANRWVRLGSFYDAGAVMLGLAESSVARLAQDIGGQAGSTRANGGRKTNGNMKAVRTGNGPRPGNLTPRHAGHINHTGIQQTPRGEGRLLRNFEQADAIAELVPPDVMAWEIAIAGFSGAHFATFPPALVVPCVLAGCPAGGTVLDPFGGAGTTGLVADRLGREAILIELNHDYAVIARDRLRAALASVSIDGAELVQAPLDGLFAERAA
ncbi:MAG: DNA-methyltransferase [Sphingopyxis sp.]